MHKYLRLPLWHGNACERLQRLRVLNGGKLCMTRSLVVHYSKELAKRLATGLWLGSVCSLLVDWLVFSSREPDFNLEFKLS